MRADYPADSMRPMRPGRARRRIVVGGFALLGTLVIVAVVLTLVGDLRLPFSLPGQTNPAARVVANQGKSVLVLSKPDTSLDNFATITLLTMVRTSDGKTLWQYHLPGDLAGGVSASLEEQLRAGTAVRIVNGVVYFAEYLGASHPNARLTALRADTGVPLWQHEMQVDSLEVLGISGGMLVAQFTANTVSTHYPIGALTVAGYRADTGALVWQHQLAAQITASGEFTSQLLDGALYVEGQSAANSPGNRVYLTTFDAGTGQLRWQLRQPIRQGVVFLSPFTAADGVVVLEGYTIGAGTGLSSLMFTLGGVRERDGALLWSYEVSPPREPAMWQESGFFDGIAVPAFQTDAHALYFATNVPNQTDLELNAVQIAHGTLLWHRQINAPGQQAITNQHSDGGSQLVLANGLLYLLYVLPAPTATPTATPDDMFVQAVRASNGALVWGQRNPPGLTEGSELVIVDGVVISAMIAWASEPEENPVIGLSAQTGAPLWRNQLIANGQIIANGKLLVFSAPPPTDSQSQQQLCALQSSTGVAQWCSTVAGPNTWLIVGP